MRFPGFPRLPVSRRRHEEVQKELERSRDRHGWSMALRKEAQDSQANCARKYQDLRTESEGLARQLVAVHNLAGDYKRERDEARARVAELEQAIREHRDRHRGNQWLWSVLDGHDHQERGDEPVTHQDGRRYRLVQDGERSFRAVEADVRHPRSGRWSRGERARDWLTGGSFKGVRRER